MSSSHDMLATTHLGSAQSPAQVLYARAQSSRPPIASSSKIQLFDTVESTRFRSDTYTSPDGVEEEVAWWDRTVVWSRGLSIHRQYTFEDDRNKQERVTWAGFVWFPPHGHTAGHGSGPAAEEEQKSAEKGKAKEGLFGPFHNSQNAIWGQPPVSPLNTAPQPLVRTLLICRREQATVFYPSGDDIKLQLPFVVDTAFPLPALDGGVILQRELSRSERRRRDGDHMDPRSKSILDALTSEVGAQPRAYALTNPFHEIKRVIEAQVMDEKIVDEGAPLGWTDNIIFSADPYPFVIAHDKQEDEIVFYARHRVPVIEKALVPAKPTYQRPQELIEELAPLSPTAPTHSRPSFHRATSGFADRRKSALQQDTNDRTRSGPRVSRGGMVEPQHSTHERTTRSSKTTADLQAALDPLPLPTGNPTRATGSRLSTRTAGRSSILGEMGAGAEVTRAGLATATEEDMRRTTMLMGLEREATDRSELVFERIWTWPVPSGADMASAKVFLSENVSATCVQLNIHDGTTLYPFSARRDDEWTIRPRQPVACSSAVPVTTTRHGVHDTLILQNRQLRLIVEGQVLPVSLPNSLTEHKDELPRQLESQLSMALDADDSMDRSAARRVSQITAAFDATVSMRLDDGESVRISLDHRIQDELVHQCLEALTWTLSPEAVFAIKWQLLLELQATGSSRNNPALAWKAFVEALETCLGLDLRVSQRQSSDASLDPLLRKIANRLGQRPPSEAPKMRQRRRAAGFGDDSLAKVLCSLHLITQDLRLGQDRIQGLSKVVKVVINLCARAGENNWLDYWTRLVPAARDEIMPAQASRIDVSELASEPIPDIIAYLSRRLLTPLTPYPIPEAPPSVASKAPLPACQATRTLIAIYDRLGVSGDAPADAQAKAASVVSRAGATVAYMIENGLDHAYINNLPVGVAMPIFEMIRVCQMAPGKGWTPEMYDFVGRSDLAVQARGVSLPSRDRDEAGEEKVPTVGEIMTSVEKDYAKHAHLLPTMPHVRFGSDKRLEEVERIMQTTRVRTIETKAPANISDVELPNWQQGEVNTIANRTLSILVGKGMFEYGTRTASITQVSEIPLIELSVKVVPGNQTLQAHIANESADWPCFHNGVAAALAISPDSKGIHSSWIVFNKPATLNHEHGGFLLGLGLSGHLRSLASFHAFPYMEPRHEYTSIGLLLGLAASFAGSEDILITKVLSLHTHALLPLGSRELNASALTQSTAMVGIGLVHVGTKNMRMAEMALGEIGRIEIPGVEGSKHHAEAYSFSVSMAFGLIMLARGGQTDSAADDKLVKGLTKRILGEAPSLRASKAAVEIDTTVTAPGATLALGLMYLKTNRQDIADILAIPSSPQELENVRPDILLIRTFARGLILWRDIYPSMDWVERQLPSFIAFKDHKNTSEMEQQTELAYLNIVAGACLAIGLKYAGTAGEAAHNTLTSFANILSKASVGPNTYEGNIRRVAARQGLGIVTIALAVVMSGTGELNTLRRIRIAHGQEGLGVNYGTHMAMHMAMGILFLGKGYYTLGSSNLAIAAMAISFFPRFLPSPADNRAYPQAFRHLWALAVEPRCLIARDVDTRETVYLPVKVTLREGGQDRVQSLISPTLIAPFESLRTIEVDSPRYWPITYDLSNPRDKRALINTRTIHVKRRSAYLDYNSDPKGNRSIYIRAGSMTGLDLHYDLISPAAPPNVTPGELVDLIKSHSGEPGLIALAQTMGGSTRFEKAVRIVLLECVTLDKPMMIPVYMSLLLALKRGVQVDRLESLRQLAMIKRFYDGTAERDYALPSRDRHVPLLRTSFVGSLWRLLVDERPAEEDRLGYWREATWPEGEESRQAMAVGLLRDGVPARECLEILRQMLREDAEGMDEGVLRLRMRDATRAYGDYVERQWDVRGEGEGDVAAEGVVWKLHSLEEGAKAWRG